MTFHERKAKRTKYYLKYVFGWKNRDCTACNGSGWYDCSDEDGNPIKCGCCEGTGKEKYKPEL